MRWTEVVRELEASRAVVASGERWLGLLWKLGSERQRQKVELTAERGRDHVVVTAGVLPLTQLSPVAVLRQNAGLMAGALALDGHTCVLRYAMRLDELDPARLRQTLVSCAHEAMRLRRLRTDAAAPTPHVVD
jgi:hypothetical protein